MIALLKYLIIFTCELVFFLGLSAFLAGDVYVLRGEAEVSSIGAVPTARS